MCLYIYCAIAGALPQENEVNNMQPQSTQPRTNAIPEATDRLHSSINNLEDIVNSLASRLHPVMESEIGTLNGAGHAEPKAPSHPVPLANDIHLSADRLNSLSHQLSGLLSRLHV